MCAPFTIVLLLPTRKVQVAKTNSVTNGFLTSLLDFVCPLDGTGAFMWKDRACTVSCAGNIRYKTSVRKATLKDHANSRQHKDAIEAEHLQRVSGLHKAAEKGKAVKDELYFNAFYSIYWLAKNEVANRKALSLLQLLQFLGIRDMTYFDHQFQRSLHEIFITLGQTEARRVLTNVRHARAYGILLDEVTDISVQEMLLAFIQ